MVHSEEKAWDAGLFPKARGPEKRFADLMAVGAEFPLPSSLELVIRVPREQLDQARESSIPEAIHNYFPYRAVASARRIRLQLREGRFALAIGLPSW